MAENLIFSICSFLIQFGIISQYQIVVFILLPDSILSRGQHQDISTFNLLKRDTCIRYDLGAFC